MFRNGLAVIYLVKKNRKAKVTFRIFVNVPGVLHLQSNFVARVHNGNACDRLVVEIPILKGNSPFGDSITRRVQPLFEGLFSLDGKNIWENFILESYNYIPRKEPTPPRKPLARTLKGPTAEESRPDRN